MAKYIVKYVDHNSGETTIDDTWFHSEGDAQNYIENSLYPALATGAEILDLRGEDYVPVEDIEFYIEEVDDDEYMDLEEDPDYGFEPDDDLKEAWRMMSLPEVTDDEGDMLACDECGAGIRWDDGEMVCQNCHKVFDDMSIRQCRKY